MALHELDICKKAAELNYSAKQRDGNVVRLPETAKVIVTGDLHGHRRNFERIVTFADLENNPETHIVFQEILHGGIEDDAGGCLSFMLFFDIIRYQIRFPDQVHLILGNHDTAVITDCDVLKAGREMNHSMKAAMKRKYGDDFAAVEGALKEYLLSEPLAVRCADRIWISHSLPGDRYIDDFDTGILDKKLQPADMLRPGPAYLLTWGRRHSEKALARMRELLDVDMFILGHQPQDTGWAVAGKDLLILACDHNHGCLVPLDLAKSYTIEQVIDCIVPLASIA
ncbi:MAG: metallophosphoesterase [Planctomycetes bacterium]|nr:metallophosphoesterase [Planctomycetota bacterium]